VTPVSAVGDALRETAGGWRDLLDAVEGLQILSQT
jgi:hypothetical protein